MNAPANLSKAAQLRARDGEFCWLCSGKLDFDAAPNSKKAPTKEHLVPLSAGGTSDLGNLVLCHPGCNKQLADRPKADKLKIKAKRDVARRRQLFEAQSAATAKTTVKPVRKANALRFVPADKAKLVRWQVAACGGGGIALFALGLATGVLIAR